MTVSLTMPQPLRHGLSVRRAFGYGVAAAGLATLGATATGLVPAALVGLVWWGTGTASLCGAVVGVMHARLLAGRADDARLAAGRMQAALGLGFLVKLVGLAAGAGALLALDTKFDGLTAFAVAFAAASLIYQVCAALVLVRVQPARASADGPNK